MPKATKEEREAFDAAVRRWGPASQIDMCIEECSELVTAICHLRRDAHSSSGDRGQQLRHVLLELADVSIVVDEVADVLGLTDLLPAARAEKIRRLRVRLGLEPGNEEREALQADDEKTAQQTAEAARRVLSEVLEESNLLRDLGEARKEAAFAQALKLSALVRLGDAERRADEAERRAEDAEKEVARLQEIDATRVGLLRDALYDRGDAEALRERIRREVGE